MEQEKDVKTEDQDTSTDKTAEGEVDTSKEDSQKGDYDEMYGDDSKQIPYKVFRERNQKLRDTEKKVKQLETNFEKKLDEQKAQIFNELNYKFQQELSTKKSPQQEEDLYDDLFDDDVKKISSKYDGKINKLEETIKSLQGTLGEFTNKSQDRDLKRNISELKVAFPSMDEEHVYTVKKMKPDWGLEECAEYSHNKWEGKVKSMFNKMLESKKEAAKKKVSVTDSMTSFKVKTKSKNAKEAHKNVMDFINQTYGEE